MYRLNSSFDSFDTLQKLILNEIENVFDDLADVTAKFNDVVQKTCWTFDNEVQITVSFKGYFPWGPEQPRTEMTQLKSYDFSWKPCENKSCSTFVTHKAGFQENTFSAKPNQYYGNPIKVFSWLSGIESSLISYADAINETGDILDIYMTVIKSVLSSRST